MVSEGGAAVVADDDTRAGGEGGSGVHALRGVSLEIAANKLAAR